MRLGFHWSCGAWLMLVLLACGVTSAPAGDPPASVEFDGRQLQATEITGHSCIALAVFATARGKDFLEQATVVQVIKNRMAEVDAANVAAGIDDFADPCTVVMEMPEFEGMRRWAFPRVPWELDPPAWHMALDVTESVMVGDYQIPRACQRATTFHRAEQLHSFVAPMVAGGPPLPPKADASATKAVCAIGDHVFFSRPAAHMVADAGARP